MKDEIYEVIQSPKPKEKQLNWKMKQKSSRRNVFNDLYVENEMPKMSKKKEKNVAEATAFEPFKYRYR